MKRLSVLLTLSLFVAITSYAQETLQFTPEQPQPGDEINFTYQPKAGVFVANDKVECTAKFYFGNPIPRQVALGLRPYEKDISLTKNGNSYTGAFSTDKRVAFIALEFFTTKLNDKGLPEYDKIDINDSIGFPILFYTQTGEIVPRASYYEGDYYMKNIFTRGERTNFIGTADLTKACFNKEIDDYPEAKYYTISTYTRFLRAVDKDEAKAYCEEKLEKAFADSINTERDYDYLITLLYGAGRKNETKFFQNLKKERKFDSDIDKLGNIFDRIAANSKENTEDYLYRAALVDTLSRMFDEFPFTTKSKLVYTSIIPFNVKLNMLCDYIQSSGSLKEGLAYGKKIHMTEKSGNSYYVSNVGQILDTLYANAETKAEKEEVIAYAKTMYDYYTNQADMVLNGIPVSIYGDENYKTVIGSLHTATYQAYNASLFYADVLLTKKGDYKKALRCLNQADMYLHKLDDEIIKYLLGDYNAEYAKIAKQCYPKKKYKQALEEIVATGKYDNNVTEELREMYKKEHASDQGFDAYITGLKKEVYADMQKEFDAQKLNEKAPEFFLKDLQGNTVTLASLKGKIVVFDFWATWCGPCRASFPAMKELVEEYKDNTEVTYLFVDSGERFDKYEDNVKAVKDIIEGGNYPFHVVLDFDKTMAKNYAVNAFPTKIIMDKNGNIRYRITGAQLDAIKLKDEIRIMIGSIK